MLTDTDSGTDRNKKQDLWKARQRCIEGLEVRKNASKKTKRCIEGLEVRKKYALKKAIERNYFSGTFLVAPGVKNPPTNAGFESSYGKIPHTMEQLSPCAATAEPEL